MRPTSNKAKDKQRDVVARQVEVFLASGGKIETVDHTANKTFKDRNKKKVSREEYHFNANKQEWLKKHGANKAQRNGIALMGQGLTV